MVSILIASSALDTRHTLRTLCEQNEWVTLEAASVYECVQIVEYRPVDLIVMSFDLDEAAPHTLYNRLQAIVPIPTLILAPYSQIATAFALGAADVLEWPAHPQIVIYRIHNLLQHQAAKRGVQTVAAVTAPESDDNKRRESQVLAEALRDTAAILNSSLEFETVLDRILASIQQVIPHDMSSIVMIDPVSKEGYGVRTLDNTGRGLEQTLSEVRLPISQIKHLQEMIDTGNSLLILDTNEFESWVVSAPTDWVRSVVSAPIHVDKEIIGFIFLNAETAGVFSAADSEHLRIFANQAGIAIRNARLYEATQNYARTLETAVSERTAELERERTQLQAILDSIGEGVQGVIYADDMQTPVYSFINPALHDLLGYGVDELNAMLNRHPAEGNPNEYTSIHAKLHDRVKESDLWKGEVRIRSKHGAMVDTGLTVTRLNRADGRMMGVVTIFRDLRREKQLDAQKKRFVASAAHELRNPIAALKARLYLLHKQPERFDHHVEIIERINTQLENLVEELLDLSRFENGIIQLKSDVTEIVSFVRETVLLIEAEAEDKGIWLIDRLMPPPLYVSIDATRMSQVVSNLLTNAINYTAEEGAITIEVRTGQPASPEEGYVLLSIADTGTGIEAQHLPHIFEPFYRAREGGRGLGLGLAIIKEIVELHGGRITVTSTIGKGTRFTVWLKLLDGGSHG